MRESTSGYRLISQVPTAQDADSYFISQHSHLIQCVNCLITTTLQQATPLYKKKPTFSLETRIYSVALKTMLILKILFDFSVLFSLKQIPFIGLIRGAFPVTSSSVSYSHSGQPMGSLQTGLD